MFLSILIIGQTLLVYSCQRPVINKVKPDELSNEAIVFKGRVKFRDEIKSTNDSHSYWVVGLTENTVYKGNPVTTDTIWLDYLGMTHGWNFDTFYEYLVIAKPSKHKFEKFRTYEPNYALISTSNKRHKRNFKREVKRWIKYADKRNESKN